jgi:CheY-like chemotaxis protein
MPKTLLVVDDSPTIREAARLALAGEDWAVVTASTSDEALELLWGQTPAAVLCDADLAGAGVELCRKIRGLSDGKELPILLMGAGATPAAAQAAGATATLPKPFGAAELAEALQAALDSESLSLDLDNLAPASEPPLTLDELEGPFSSAGVSPASAAEEVEIIDLSGDEEYGDLEVLEDLEPLAADPARSFGEPPAEPLTAEPFSFGADDLFAGPAATEPAREEPPGEPIDEINLDALFSAAPPAPPAAPVPEELTPDEPLPPAGSEEPPGFLASAAGVELTVETPLASWDESLTPQQSSVGPSEEPFAFEPSWEEPSPSAPVSTQPHPPASLAAATEDAVRAALATTLSLESLTPTVERVVERVVWEVVPRLAERLIREAIEKLQTEPSDG